MCDGTNGPAGVPRCGARFKWCIRASPEPWGDVHLVTWIQFGAISCLVLAALFGPAPGPARAGTSSGVECGQVSGFVAPDPVAPAPGSLTIGLLPAWPITADAVVGAIAAASLPSLVGVGPSCVAFELDGTDQIVALDFASQGTVSGAVVFEPGLPGYVYADRLLVPTFVTDAYPGLAAIFATSADAGTDVTMTFLVDTTSGQLTGFDATAGFCGPGDLDAGGNGVVGAASIPAVVLDADATTALAGADLRDTCATVSSAGTIDQSGIAVETDVTISVVPAPPDTATDASATVAAAPFVGSPIAYLALAALGLLALGAAARRRSR